MNAQRDDAHSLASLLDLRAEQRTEHPFLVWEPFSGTTRVWSYGEFAERTVQLAAGLQRRGLRSGDRLLLHMDNSPEFLLAWFACVRAGVVPVCTNTRSVEDELTYLAEHSNAVAAVTQPSYATLVDASAPGLRFIAVSETDAGEPPGQGSRPAAADVFERLVADEHDFRPPPLHRSTPASIQFTSGTSARPKAVVWSHANCLWGARVSAAHETLVASDVHLVHLPLFHTNAQSYSVLASLWAGATIVLQPAFSASRFWEVSLRQRCTWTSVVTFCVRALDAVDAPPAHCYRLWGSGQGSPPQDARFGVQTLGWWGMTETITHGIVDDVRVPGRPMSCGRAAPEYEVAVRQPDGSPVGPDETGELFIRGERGGSLFAGYLHDEEATRAAIDDRGWLTTGDRVTVHTDGSITFADRAKDMLKVGGENVAASEVEAVLKRVPEVADAAVVGRPDRMRGEIPVAFVVPRVHRDGLADELIAACSQRLADFKVPREVRLVAELPRATLEKVAKEQLRRLLAEDCF